MRQIKFKGQTKSGHWVIGNLVRSRNGNPVIIEINEKAISNDINYWLIDAPAYEVIEETIGRFTSLTDKDREDIYSDIDIVKFKFLKNLHEPIELTGIFFFDETELRYQIEIFNSDEYTVLNYFYNGQMFDFKIIGNKFENPELL